MGGFRMGAGERRGRTESISDIAGMDEYLGYQESEGSCTILQFRDVICYSPGLTTAPLLVYKGKNFTGV